MNINENPFYRPLWRRIAILAVTGGWAFYDGVIAREPIWTMVWGAIFVYSFYAFIINYPKQPKE
ncbi:DUF3329 domain-containing protein [Aestuariivirga litoralis]|uniref:DUF3329 domain-containing protein n=1 Tax=Aestuariivirga litoralis TaxID=2650924 RepID=UPI0018C7A1DD|nr:DUF3329 domain-containing protein [Aestuariivirga litoralis]MBG1233164.1 DUF3329 domain-containing protein [Aestuariivirga litoralis]